MRRNRTPETEALTHAFAQRARTARGKQQISQVQLQEQLADRGILIDSSGITRIEAGEREPRLSEALAISEVLGFGLANLMTPVPENDAVRDVRRLMDESRESLLKLLRAMDHAADTIPLQASPPDATADDRQ